MLGGRFTWEKVGRRWRKELVFPAFSQHFPAFPTFSHIVFFRAMKHNRIKMEPTPLPPSHQNGRGQINRITLPRLAAADAALP